MKYQASTTRPTGLQLADLERFYLEHGKDPLFIESVRNDKNIRTIGDRFQRVIDQLNREQCRTVVPNGIGVQSIVYLPDPFEELEEPDEDPAKPMIWTVCICNIIQPYECMPWVSSFSSEEKAQAFKVLAEEHIRAEGVENLLCVTIDSGELDSESYIEQIHETYSMDRDE